MLLRVGSKGDDVERVQAGLNQAIAAGLVEDGDFGPATASAVAIFQLGEQLEPDEMVGEQTWLALFGDPYAPLDTAPAAAVGFDPTEVVKFEPWDGPSEDQPAGRDEMYARWGDPGRGQEDEAWSKRNLVYCVNKPGFLDPLPGAEHFTRGSWVRVHKEVEPYLREAMRRADDVCPGYITSIGVHKWRHQRGDVSRPLSDHSWAGAADINSQDNGARNYKRGEAPLPHTPKWWKVWPKGVPQGVVAAFESCGFEWGGRWLTYADPMHFEWTAGRTPDQV